jgi:spermidine synthase
MTLLSAHQIANQVSPRVHLRLRGKTRELRVDGTFASLYRPGTVTTGSVWDALAAPLLLARSLRTVLILGLGGGSAARLVRALAPQATIVGVEYDAEVVTAARRWFDLDTLGVDVVVDDARRFLDRETRRFDAVIEDIFVGNGRTVRKPDWIPEPGLIQALHLMNPQGILVSNTIGETRRVLESLRRHGAAEGVVLSVEDYENRVLAMGPGLNARSLRRAVAAHPLLSATLSKLTFRSLTASPSR